MTAGEGFYSLSDIQTGDPGSELIQIRHKIHPYSYVGFCLDGKKAINDAIWNNRPGLFPQFIRGRLEKQIDIATDHCPDPVVIFADYCASLPAARPDLRDLLQTETVQRCEPAIVVNVGQGNRHWAWSPEEIEEFDGLYGYHLWVPPEWYEMEYFNGYGYHYVSSSHSEYTTFVLLHENSPILKGGEMKNENLARRVARTLAATGQYTNAEIQTITGLKKMQVAGFAAAASRKR